jgi:hypothetical protein
VGEDRREDWHNSVEKRLVDLNSAQLTADTELAKLRKEAIKTDDLLRGEGNTPGLVADIDELKREVRKFNAIFNKDYLGHGGLQSFVTYVYNQLKSREEFQSQGRGYKWAFWTALAVAVIGLAGVVITNKDQIEKWLPKYHMNPLDKKIEKAKHPKGKKIYVTHIVPAKKEEPDADTPSQLP